MNNIDLFSHLARSVIGSDYFFTNEKRPVSPVSKYPPCNISKKGDVYTISLAVAGFSREELSVEVDYDESTKNKILTIKGSNEHHDDEDVKYLCRDIASRNFTKKFNLVSENLTIEDVNLKDGMLTIQIHEYKPECTKPYQIEIQ